MEADPPPDRTVKAVRVKWRLVGDVLRAQRERRTDTALNTAPKIAFFALPPDALLCVARCSAHA
eukprot:1280130-Prymnesium_polylepis.1